MRGIRGTCKMIPWRCRCCALHRPEGDPCAKGWWGRQAQPAPRGCRQKANAFRTRVHVNSAPKINPNNWVIRRSLISASRSNPLVARTIFSVQKSFRRTGKRRSQSVQGRCPRESPRDHARRRRRALGRLRTAAAQARGCSERPRASGKSARWGLPSASLLVAVR
jgi:hypothetical protein